MADFCNQCVDECGMPGRQDLAGITKQVRWDAGYASVVICECCGPIQVDPDGNCISGDCYGAEPRRGPCKHRTRSVEAPDTRSGNLLHRTRSGVGDS